MLPWKQAAKLYRIRYKVAKREVELEYKLNEIRYDCISKQDKLIATQAMYIAQLEHLIETGTERD